VEVVVGEVTPERWAAVEPWLSTALLAKVRNGAVVPRWLAGEDRFWVSLQVGDGLRHVIVDAATGEKSPLFDDEGVLGALRGLGVEDAFEISDVCVEGDLRSFSLGGQRFRCRADRSELERLPALHPSFVVDPTGVRAVFVRGHDLWVRDLVSGLERRVTSDGVVDYGYGEPWWLPMGQVSQRRTGVPRTPDTVVWSPDGRYLLALRIDRRSFPERPTVVEFAPPDAPYSVAGRARVEVPGDHRVPARTLSIVDVEAGTSITSDLAGGLLEDYAAAHLVSGGVWWDLERAIVYVETANRRSDTFGIAAVDLETGAARQVYAETEQYYYTFNQNDDFLPNFRVLPASSEFIWYSQRDGWGHLYLYDLVTGALKGAITQGEWVVRDLLHVDEVERVVYFTGAGKEAGRNPYYRHLYRVGLGGGEPELLTPEDADHAFDPWSAIQPGTPSSSSISPSGQFVVDTYSTLSEPPSMVIRRCDGSFVADVVRADASELIELGWRAPQAITTIAADGETVLYGAMYTPRDLDPAERYPVIEVTYPGPQGPYSPVSFQVGASNVSHLFAELGFVVVAFDGRGCAGRSRAYRYAFAGTEDVFGSADHRAGLEHLATEFPFIDLTRIGVLGASYGGYGSTRALLLQPDFYTACVSGVGPADYRAQILPSIYVDRFFLQSDDPEEADKYYELTSNTRLADRLAGKLLLIHGEIDETVQLNQAFLMYEALQQADKDFDTLILTNEGHMAFATPYAVRQTARFFVRHLCP
jgi:dipeptidyl-peptidase-4